MVSLRSRFHRVRGFARVVVAALIGSVAIVTAIAYWQDRVGYLAVAILGGTALATLAGVVVLPERAWVRITGTDTLADDLGKLHAEGAILGAQLPWVPDAEPEGFAVWAAETDAWFARVQARLADTNYLGTLLSPVGGFRTSTTGYDKASGYRNGLNDKLERLSQIIASIGRR